jgi:GT2 family glycosyltransferase
VNDAVSTRHDLAIIIVSTNEAKWLRPCLTSVFAHAGGVTVDVVVADNESTDGTRELVEGEFPAARVVLCANRGFSHANNRALATCDARYVLFLNPDTEILEGSFDELVAALDARPEVGLVGVKQVTADGELFPTVRRRPTALRQLGEALWSEQVPIRLTWLGERELDLTRYERELEIDWTSGSFMIARREALQGAGFLDERFFIYSEETDLCLRIKEAGWSIRHLPQMTILHHAQKAGVNPKMEAQGAYARKQFARKHFAPVYRSTYLSALSLRHALRLAAFCRPGEHARQRREAAGRALRVLVGLDGPPFGPPPAQSYADLPQPQLARVVPAAPRLAAAEPNGARAEPIQPVRDASAARR